MVSQAWGAGQGASGAGDSPWGDQECWCWQGWECCQLRGSHGLCFGTELWISAGSCCPQALGAGWGQSLSDTLCVPREMWGSGKGPQVSQTSSTHPESFPSREDFPFPPWPPLLLFSTWLPPDFLGFFISSITTTGRHGLVACALPRCPLGLGTAVPSLGTSPARMGQRGRASRAVLDFSCCVLLLWISLHCPPVVSRRVHGIPGGDFL